MGDARPLRLTKHVHSCVRLTRGGTSLVVDPGGWCEPAAFADVDAVLVTHEHGDHLDASRLAAIGVPMFAPAGIAAHGLDVVEVTPGEVFDAAGFQVRAVATPHAAVYQGLPDPPHCGYLIEELVFHPGDSLHVPEVPLGVLCVPIHASWMRTSEAIDVVRALAPQVAVGVHEGQLNERGLSATNDWMTRATDGRYRYLRPSQSITIGGSDQGT